jgi:hypothetical protein
MRIIDMKSRKSIAVLLTLAVITLMAAIGSLAQSASSVRSVQIPQGQKQKIRGVVSSRSGDTFKVRDPEGAETTVILLVDTDVTCQSKGIEYKKAYPMTYIMRGLRLYAEGTGDAKGRLVADNVWFDDRDLLSAQALEQAPELAAQNEARTAATELTDQGASTNAERIAGRVSDTSSVVAPSLEETAMWLLDTLRGREGPGWSSSNQHNDYLEFEGCKMVYRRSTSNKGEDMRVTDTAQLSYLEGVFGPKEPSSDIGNGKYVTLKFKEGTVITRMEVAVQGRFEGKDHRVSAIEVYVGNDELTPRVVKAFTRLQTLCAAKPLKEPF